MKGPPAWVPPAGQASHPHPPRKILSIPSRFPGCSLPCAGGKGAPAATPPPTPCWTPPSAEPPGEITGSHMKGNFSQAEMELKAASHLPRLPPLCQARLLSSWCWKGACGTRETVEGQNPNQHGCFPPPGNDRAIPCPSPLCPLSFRSSSFRHPQSPHPPEARPHIFWKSFLKPSLSQAGSKQLGGKNASLSSGW